MSSFSNMAYDGVFNLKGETASSATWYPAPGTLNWSYDNKDRLTTENSARGSANWTQNFGYDNAGNPTSFKGMAQTFNANNQQTGVSSYDGNGNPVSYRGSAASFDQENRMTSLGSGFTAGYRFDGLRAWKGTGDARTYYLYDQGEPIIELDSKGNIQAMNVFAPDGLVGRWSTTGTWAKSWSYYVFDQQGNVDHRTDATGGLRSSSVYDAYGLDRANAGKDDPFGYNGRWGYYRDVETGLYLCQHRCYDPSTGRWLTRDPIGYSGGIALYGYCGGGPISGPDPRGHSKRKIFEALNSQNPCEALKRLIMELGREINEKLHDLETDRHDLFNCPSTPVAKGGNGTRGGHLDQVFTMQRGLYRAIQQYGIEGCDPNDPFLKVSLSLVNAMPGLFPLNIFKQSLMEQALPLHPGGDPYSGMNGVLCAAPPASSPCGGPGSEENPADRSQNGIPVPAGGAAEEFLEEALENAA